MAVLFACRRMSNLAAKFTGSGVHVVDPVVDLRYLFSDDSNLKRSLQERNLNVDISEVEAKYMIWWKKYQDWINATAEQASSLKKALRDAQGGLLQALALPNVVKESGMTQKDILKASKHAEYLCGRGLMRVDKENEVVSLIGWPVLLQQSIKNQLLDMFPDSLLISPSCFARAAVMEAVHMKVEDYLQFTDLSASFPVTYLVGHSLPALLTPFVRTTFTESNKFPIAMQSVGMSYHAKRNRPNLAYACQRLKHCLLSISPPGVEDDISSTATVNIGGLLTEGLDLDIKIRTVNGPELRNYESRAIAIEERGLELARVSEIDDYISRRLNITSEIGFLNMVYIETDINRIVARMIDGLIDGREVPKVLRAIL